MKCNESKQLIPLHLDGELPNAQDELFTDHLACCESCARELMFLKRLSGSLHEIGRDEIQAPPGLSVAVMGRLKQERRSAITWFPAAWRKAVAAAAAILLLAGGSAGVAAGLKMAGNGNMIVYETPTVKDPGGGVAASPDNSPLGDTTQLGNPAGEDPSKIAQNNGSDPSNNTDNGTDGISPEDGLDGKVSAAGAISSKVTPVLMSTGMKITSTMIKVTVGDLAEARAKAVALAAGAGAVTQVFPEQNGGKRIVVIRLTATFESAPDLIARLASLGTMFDRQDESRDITALYNETLIQYHDLQSRISSTHDAGERLQMEAQAASYKQMLDAWEAEAGKRIVTLWLEGN